MDEINGSTPGDSCFFQTGFPRSGYLQVPWGILEGGEPMGNIRERMPPVLNLAFGRL